MNAVNIHPCIKDVYVIGLLDHVFAGSLLIHHVVQIIENG